jgi:fermentation-respiration switch protein FrsA (DUF1100 family)
MLTSVLTAALLAYAGLVAVLYVAQRSLMYSPGHDLGSPGDHGLPELSQLSIRTADGLTLTSWYLAPSPGRSVLVYFQGNAGTIGGREHKVRPFIEAGFGVMLVGYRGFGNNPGSPTEEGLYADGMGALAWLSENDMPPSRWVLYGESLGSGIATELAWRQAREGAPVGALVLEAPFTSMGDAAASHYPYVPARLLVRDRFDSLAKIDAIETKLLVVHGTRDRTVPFNQGEALFTKAREPKAFHRVENAGHADLFDFRAQFEVLKFLGA